MATTGRIFGDTIRYVEERRPWLGSKRMWVEVVVVSAAVCLAYWALGNAGPPAAPESPETDGESIEWALQLAGAVVTLVVTAALMAGFELTWRLIGARRRTSS